MAAVKNGCLIIEFECLIGITVIDANGKLWFDPFIINLN